MPKHSRLNNHKNRKSRLQKNKRKRNYFGFIIIFFILALAMSTLSLFVKLNKLETFTYVEEGSDGQAIVRKVDSRAGSMYEVVVPPETEISLSYNLGTYKIKSAWILAHKEGHEGELIAKSILKNYKIPIYFWKNRNGSNLSFFQDLKVNLVNLGAYRMDSQNFVADSGDLPYYINLEFSIPDLAEKSVKVEVVDATGSFGLLPSISRVIEVMGGKIANNARVQTQDIDCLVSGRDKKSALIVAKVFSCSYEESGDVGIDVKLTLGKKFADRF